MPEHNLLGIQLYNAARDGRLDEVKNLVEKEKAPINYQKQRAFRLLHNGSTPLWIAAYNGHKEVVEYLMDHGADPSIFTQYCQDAFWAAQYAHSKVSKETRDEIESKLRKKKKISFTSQLDALPPQSCHKNKSGNRKMKPPSRSNEEPFPEQKVLNIPESSIHKERKIGCGGFSTVYKGTWNSTTVAIKKMKQFHENPDSVRDEIRILTNLRHPRIILLMGVCVSETRCLLIFEYMEGLSLFKRIHQDKKPLNEKEIIKTAQEIAEGMSYLHSRKVIHGDLKSKNILLGSGGSKISDFGLSKMRTTSIDSSSTFHGGTMGWTAPEIFKEGKIGKSSDVYSYGVVVWEMVTNAIPWKEYNPMNIPGLILAGKRLRVPSNCNATVSRIMKSCFEDIRPTFDEVLQMFEDQSVIMKNKQKRYEVNDSYPSVEIHD